MKWNPKRKIKFQTGRIGETVYWYTWFSWYPVYIIDIDKMCWLEKVWVREVSKKVKSQIGTFENRTYTYYSGILDNEKNYL